MKRQAYRLKSSHTTIAALLGGTPIPVSTLSWRDFPDSLQGELRRALSHTAAYDLCITYDAEARLIHVETRAEAYSWLKSGGSELLARQVRAACLDVDQVLILVITPQETGLRTLKLNEILAPEDELPPVWANIGEVG